MDAFRAATQLPTESDSVPPEQDIDPACDPVAIDITRAVHELEDGRLTRARLRLEAIWARLAVPEAADAASSHRCAVAHWLAATQTEPTVKLEWDLRALDEAESVPDWSTIVAGTGHSIGALYPDLHLELARNYLRGNDACGVLEHLALARNAVEVLPPARRVRLHKEIARVDAELNRRSPEPEDWGWDRMADCDFTADDLADELADELPDDDGAG
ncbi:MAG TPA: hypothetical protein VLR26_17525 [Frankiaceae bacterium]|nr:hypothetical protein [Frankiaceae bacterium]